MIKLILIFSLISNICFAQNAVHLSKGEESPFEGDLLTLETTKQLYDDSLEKSSLQKQLDLTNSNNTILMQEKQILLDQNKSLIENSVKDHNLNTIEKIVWIVVGGLAVYSGAKVAESVK